MKKIISLFSNCVGGFWIIAEPPALAATSTSLIGDWKLVSYGSPASPTPAAPDVDTSIVFGEDGK